MSNWFELTSIVMQAAFKASEIQTCANQGGICPATAFNPITAAFATQGYFMQADMLYFLVGTGFGMWAPFIYMIAAAGGIISLAMGAPPKMYVWFFVGPGIYHWLVETRAPAHGVQWQVARVLHDQRQVWRLAHVGLLNSNIAARMAGDLKGVAADARYEPQTDLTREAWCKPTPSPVYVSNFFLWFDQLISYTVQRVVDITGITRTSIKKQGTGGNQGVLEYSGASATNNNWYLMSDKKWVLLDTITSARLNNSDIRDAFTSFLSSECGDALASAVDNTNFVIASNSSNGQMPCTVILHDNTAQMRSEEKSTSDCAEKTSNENGAAGSAFLQDQYYLLNRAMSKIEVPIPETFRRIFQDKAVGSFVYFLNGVGGGTVGSSTNGPGDQMAAFFRNQDSGECHAMFYTLVQALRWEAGQIYHQLIQSGPIGLEPEELLYNLFYGWGVRDSFGGELLSKEKMENWTINLILVHLIRNELAVAPRVADKKFSNVTTLQSYTQNYIAQTGSKTKYGEVYSWARMIPYIQGILLYLLAMGYPFACIMIVMPGWHKTLFTWMSFWVWVKMWDAGFAVVTVIERSIWSMLGNSTKLNYTSPLINQMVSWGEMTLNKGCTPGGAAASTAKECFADMQSTLSCRAIPDFVNTFTGGGGAGAGTPWYYTAAIFDRALLLASNIDIDVSNGYYIYLMSALYFAVPAATGQLILGAKAGVAGMANTLMQGAQQDAGKGVSSGFLGNMRGQIAGGTAAMKQEAHAKGARVSGFAEKSFDQANASLGEGLNQGKLDAAGRQLGAHGQNLGQAKEALGARVGATSARLGYRQLAGGLAAGGWNVDDPSYRDITNGNVSLDFANAVGNAKDAAKKYVSPSKGSPSNLTPQPSGALEGGGLRTGLEAIQTGTGLWQTASGGASGLYFGPMGQIRQSLSGAAKEAISEGIAADFTSRQAGLNTTQAGYTLGAFDSSSRMGALSAGEKRYGSAAEFAGQSQGYYASRNLSDSAAGYIGSLGGDASVVGPSSKPTDMTGMAMIGRFGMGAQQSSTWATSGFYSSQGDATAWLGNNYGQGYVKSGYSSVVNSPKVSSGNLEKNFAKSGLDIADSQEKELKSRK